MELVDDVVHRERPEVGEGGRRGGNVAFDDDGRGRVDLADGLGGAALDVPVAHGREGNLLGLVHEVARAATGGVSVSEIARAAGCSRSYLDKRFRAKLGATVRETVLRERIERVKRLLSTTNRSMTEIAVSPSLRLCGEAPRRTERG